MHRTRQATSLIILLLSLLALGAPPTQASRAVRLPGTSPSQDEVLCGTVDAIDFPFLDVGSGGWTIRYAYGQLRSEWGHHAGEDWFRTRGDSYGQPVRAIANGRVTYSEVTGWGRDKGVVIVEHTLRDGSVVYSLYGHLEEVNGYYLPETGACVRRGDIVGAVGRPRSAPHLHFEIRHMWSRYPGPGYWPLNPSDSGWENPSAFIINWRAYLNPAYLWHVELLTPMTANPAVAPDGTIYVAQANYIQSLTSEGAFLWRSALPDDMIIDYLFPDNDGVTVYTRDGQLIRYKNTLMPDPDVEPIQFGGQYDTLTPLGGMVFLHSNDGTLRLYDQTLALRGEWREVGRPASTAQTDRMLAISTGQRTPELLLFSREGVLLQRSTPRRVANVAPAEDGGIYVHTRYALWHVSPGADWTFLTDEFEFTLGGSALASDAQGSLYFYAGGLNSEFYSWGPDGSLHWAVSLGQESFSPSIALGEGCVIYLAAADGRLLAVNAATGAHSEPLAIYPGNAIGGRPWLHIRSDESILFAVGGTQIIAIDGMTLAGLETGAVCTPPFR